MYKSISAHLPKVPNLLRSLTSFDFYFMELNGREGNGDEAFSYIAVNTALNLINLSVPTHFRPCKAPIFPTLRLYQVGRTSQTTHTPSSPPIEVNSTAYTNVKPAHTNSPSTPVPSHIISAPQTSALHSHRLSLYPSHPYPSTSTSCNSHAPSR